MAVAFRSVASTNTGTSVQAICVPKPACVAAGDLMIAVIERTGTSCDHQFEDATSTCSPLWEWLAEDEVDAGTNYFWPGSSEVKAVRTSNTSSVTTGRAVTSGPGMVIRVISVEIVHAGATANGLEVYFGTVDIVMYLATCAG